MNQVVQGGNGVGGRNGANGSAVKHGETILDVQHLQKFFPIKRGFLQKTIGNVRAVDDVSFDIKKGETLALVGESGCGKTTTSRCVLRAIDPTGGSIKFTTENGTVMDVAQVPRHQLRSLRRQMQMVFQDPFSSLNPRMTILDIIGEPMLVNGIKNRQERIDRVEELLRLVGLRPEFMRRFPHAFSAPARRHRSGARPESQPRGRG
jgi:peptide/nickel transport system ATP-binding protein